MYYRCDCPKHLSGPSCSQDITSSRSQTWQTCKAFGHLVKTCFTENLSLCLNQCNHRGRCISGFCHCNPGEWGSTRVSYDKFRLEEQQTECDNHKSILEVSMEPTVAYRWTTRASLSYLRDLAMRPGGNPLRSTCTSYPRRSTTSYTTASASTGLWFTSSGSGY